MLSVQMLLISLLAVDQSTGPRLHRASAFNQPSSRSAYYARRRRMRGRKQIWHGGARAGLECLWRHSKGCRHCIVFAAWSLWPCSPTPDSHHCTTMKAHPIVILAGKTRSRPPPQRQKHSCKAFAGLRERTFQAW